MGSETAKKDVDSTTGLGATEALPGVNIRWRFACALARVDVGDNNAFCRNGPLDVLAP
jgi:hypothetical protein